MTPRPTDSDAFDDDSVGTAGDEALRRLLGDAVAGVRPTDRLGEIRRRTRRRSGRSRRWLPVVAGAGVATAAVVGGVVLLGQLGNDEPAPAAQPERDLQLVQATAVYFVGDTELGPRLFREFQSVPVADRTGTVERALARVEPAGGPVDPDYRTLWPDSSFAGVDLADDRVTIELADSAALERPAGVSNREAWIGIQQVVYTAEASLGESLPVAFEYDGAPARRVLGVEVQAVVERDRQYDVMSPVNISDPDEGMVVDGDVLHARGTRTDLAAEVRWTVEPVLGEDEKGLAFGGPTTTRLESGDPGDMGGLAWVVDVDVSALRPGDYVFSASVRSTGQASDSPAGFSDTRTFTIP